MKTVTIYITQDKKNFRIIRPSKDFVGDYEQLVNFLTEGVYHSFVVV